jgi:uracil-DNA glycosylase
MTFSRLMHDIRACTYCLKHLPCGPRPVVQAHPEARLLIVGQAPGRLVHETGIAWNDKSGDRLRQWLGIDKTFFYDARKVALVPMGFCYPGKGPSGDLPPRPECAPLWHAKLLAQMPDIRLTLLVGQYAQAYYLKERRKKTLTDTVRAWRDYMPAGFLPLVHPSPRNQIWLRRNAWFEKEIIPELQRIVASLRKT